MKVLAIVGSPRARGNSFKVTQRIEQHLKQLGDVDFEYLPLSDANLGRCRGCFSCIARGEELCPLKDDRALIENKMMNANGVIFVSPAYANNVTGLMKNFIDRFAYIGHRPRFFNQCAMLVSTTGYTGLKPTLNALSYLACGGFYATVKLGVRTPPYPLPIRTQKKSEALIHRAARTFYMNMSLNKRPSPSMAQIIHFRVFRTLYRYDGDYLATYFPRDCAHWTEKGWLKPRTDYFVNVKMGILQKTMGRAFESTMAFFTGTFLFDRIRKESSQLPDGVCFPTET